jgi:hypothetical protein
MKPYKFLVLIVVGCVLLASCNLGAFNEGSYRWYGVGQRLGFAGIAFALDGSIYGSDQKLGSIRYDPNLNFFAQVDTPGSFKARYVVGDDGTEYVSDYGIYARAAGAVQWTLLPESRSRMLEYVYAAKNGDLFARTIVSSSNLSVYVIRLKGSSSWTALNEQPTQVANQPYEITHDFTGRTYLNTSSSNLMLLEGAKATVLPEQDARIFDWNGERYKTVDSANGRDLMRVNASGQLEMWGKISESGPILKYLGFGKDGRYYAIAGFSSILGSGYRQNDIIAVSKGNPKWVLAASSVSNGDGTLGGPVTTDTFNSAFSADGSLYFYGCQGTCGGNGNAANYLIYRLIF